MSEISSSENNPAMTTPENDVNNENEAGVLTQEDVNEQIGSYLGTLAKQLEDST